MRRRRFPFVLVVLGFGVGACSDGSVDPDAGQRPVDASGADAPAMPDAGIPDATPGPDADPAMPLTLRETGLYSDFENEILAPGVESFRPEYVLWSDGAEKERWVYLPPGAVIDTSNMDFWEYPEGTKLWKQFTVEGVRVETRLLFKTGPEKLDWYMVAYAWNEEQTEALAVPLGMSDAMGTNHDIPGRTECRGCHFTMWDVALGFSAIQLDHDLGGLTLSDLIASSRLSAPPALGALDIPGDNLARPALGYLHANCGNCHNENSPVADSVDMRLWLKTEGLSDVINTSIYQTTVGITPQFTLADVTSLIEPAAPAASAVYVRMNARNVIGMPPLGSEIVDDTGVGVVDAWIESLPVE